MVMFVVPSIACAREPKRDATLALPDARSAYASTTAKLEAKRRTLASRYVAAKHMSERHDLQQEAREAVLTAITTKYFSAWSGTPWDFNGTSQVPGQGSIACGYFVTTLVSHAGFRIARAHLAQQVSELIVKTLAPSSSTWRFRKGDPNVVIRKVKDEGEGLYVVGLDNHVGFLWNDAGLVKFCHASYVGTKVAGCERADTSAAFASNYHVVGRLLTPKMMSAWLTGSQMTHELDAD